MKFIGIIPARFASTRFPGKLLVEIGGKYMIQRVYEQATKALDFVVVATDDERIEKAVHDFKGIVIMTSLHHKSGTDRCSEAIQIIHQSSDVKYDVVINIQGDEPFIQPEQLKIIMNCFKYPDTQIATLIKPIYKSEDIFNPNYPKVIINHNQEAIYFSRSAIPYIRSAEKNNWIKQHQFYKHIGIYAFKVDILKEILKLKPSALELAESLEQNRWIENGYKIKVEKTELESVSIDTPADLVKIKKMRLF